MLNDGTTYEIQVQSYIYVKSRAAFNNRHDN